MSGVFGTENSSRVSAAGAAQRITPVVSSCRWNEDFSVIVSFSVSAACSENRICKSPKQYLSVAFLSSKS